MICEQHYMLMHDKKGWRSLLKKNVGLNSEYMRIQRDLPEVDVPKGTLVKVDPDCLLTHLKDVVHVSLTVISVDHFENQENQFENLKLTVISKELIRLEQDVYSRLKPCSPTSRYKIMTDGVKYPLIGAKIGDTVYVQRTPNSNRNIGIIQYIGPLDGIGQDSVWFGVELLDGKCGQSDGTLGQKRYFDAPPFSAVFTSAEALTLYDDQDDLDQIQGRITQMTQAITKDSRPPSKNNPRPNNGNSNSVTSQQQQQIKVVQQRFEQSKLKNRMEEYKVFHNNQNEKKQVDLANGNCSLQTSRVAQRVTQIDNAAARKGQTLERDDWPALPTTVSPAQKSGPAAAPPSSQRTLNRDTKPSFFRSGQSNDPKPSFVRSGSFNDPKASIVRSGSSNDPKTSIVRSGPSDDPKPSIVRSAPSKDPKAVVAARASYYRSRKKPKDPADYISREWTIPVQDGQNGVRYIPNPALVNLPWKQFETVAYMKDNKEEAQFGKVRWVGFREVRDRKRIMPNRLWLIGVELDNPVGSGDGCFNGTRYFYTPKMNHAVFAASHEFLNYDEYEAHVRAKKMAEDAAASKVSPSKERRPDFAVPKSPSLASRLRASVGVDSPKNLRPDRTQIPQVDELDLKKLSPLSQFKKSRQLHQQQIEEQKNRCQQQQQRNGQESDENGTSLSSNEINWSSSGSSASPATRQKNNEPPKIPPKKSSPELRKNNATVPEVSAHQLNGGNSVSNRPNVDNRSRTLGRERDPYASEHFVVAAEVHPQSATPPRKYSPQLIDISDPEDSEADPIQILPEFDRLQSDVRHSKQVEVGTLVELLIRGQPVYGVVKWIGFLPPPDHQMRMAGIEMEEELLGTSNGWHNGTHMFPCPEGKGVFVPFTHFRLDGRFDHGVAVGGKTLGGGMTSPELNNQFGNLDCPKVPGSYPPICGEEMLLLCGRNRGIQGHQNSCYLDATLFAMFSFTSVFDCLLFRPPTHEDIHEYREVQRVLREEIVNPLRKNHFVRADRVMKLRQLLDTLTSVRGLTSEEKDPEEFLNSLLSQTLRASPFLELSSGQTSHLYQLFVERDESKFMPSVQDLFEQSFLTSGVKLKKVPSVMILQMPRFGKQFKVYNRILPSLILDVTDIIEDSPRQCIVCGKLATYECAECFGEHATGLDSTSFCESCLTTQHRHQKRQKHKWSQLKVPEEFLAQRLGNSECANRRLFMELFAVVCIETSHYVTFVKSGLGPDAPWCFFDSMADRKGEQHGYNIPEVTNVPHLSNWLTEDGVSFLNKCQDDKLLPEQAKRLICDGYMCFYQSSEVMMYQ